MHVLLLIQHDVVTDRAEYHETAKAVMPGARVAYVDNDPVAVSHL